MGNRHHPNVNNAAFLCIYFCYGSKFRVNPDTAYFRQGDTIVLKTSLSSSLSNGVKIEDGKATIDLYMGYSFEIPVNTF